MTADRKGREWTADEVRREEQAQRARVRRDAARGVTRNLSDAVAHTEFAKRFARLQACAEGMTEVLNPEPLLRALHDASVQHIVIGGFAVNAHGVIRPSKDLHIVPDPDPENLERPAPLLAELDARHVGLGDFEADEFPFDPTRPEDLLAGANFRLETRLGDLDVMQWVAGIDTDPAYAALAADAIEGELDGIRVRVCGLEHLIAMKRAAGRPRDLDDLQRLGAG